MKPSNGVTRKIADYPCELGVGTEKAVVLFFNPAVSPIINQIRRGYEEF